MHRQGKDGADKALGQRYLPLDGLYPAKSSAGRAGVYWPPSGS
jgi:hypothetical protein